MKNVIMLFIVNLLFISVLTVFLPIETCRAVDGNTLYVGGIGPGNYTKIQNAIDDAHDGDTIYVYSGIYIESWDVPGMPRSDNNVVVNKSINLIGQNKETTIIDGGGYGDIVKISADWVNISGFTLKDSGTYSVGIDIESNNCTIEKIVTNNHMNGIWLQGGSNNTIIGNIINDNYRGINFQGSANNYLFNNIINNNTIDGIALFSTSRGQSSNNKIIGNTIINNGYGIEIYWGSNYTHISGNNVSSKDSGILIYGDYNTVIENNITNCNYGIFVSPTDLINTISNNLYSNNEVNIEYQDPIITKVDGNGTGMPGFEVILVFCALALIFILKRKRKG